MSDHEKKKPTVGAGGAPRPKLPGILSEAGRILSENSRIADSFSPLQHDIGRDRPVPPPQKPSKSRARAAHELAKLGANLLKDGRHAQAIEEFKRSVSLDPTVAEAHDDLGVACLIASRFAEAADAFRTAVSLKPNFSKALANLAIVLDLLGREEEALSAYEAAVKLAPKLHQAQARLGYFYQMRGRRAEAEAAYRAAAAGTAGTPQAKIHEARAANVAGATAKAEALLRAVIAADPACTEAYGILGPILSQHGKSAEAVACFERCIALDPGMAAAWQGIAINRKFTAADQPLIERMEACLERPGLTPSAWAAVHFALGKVNDDIGNYAEAIKHFDAANGVRAAAIAFDRAQLVRQAKQIIGATPAGFLDQRRDLGLEDETPILIVGMPRSGTTLVERILSSHPDVAPGGELRYWRDLSHTGMAAFDAATTPDSVRRVADDYLAVLRAVSDDAARVTDKMPFNFATLGFIRQIFPRAAIVHCRRHPVDTCLSVYCTDFDEPLDFACERGRLVFFYRQYERLMAHWREVLPPERFIEVDYEELVADPEPLTRRMLAACGLEWNDACLAPQRNERPISTASLWQARQPIYRTSVARWKQYEPWLGELRELLPAVS